MRHQHLARQAAAGAQVAHAGREKPPKSTAVAVRPALEEIGAADEAGDEAGPRAAYSSNGRVDLLDPALVHHRDAVRGDHRLGLVVRDVDHGDPELVVQAADLEAHLLAQVGVQVGQRLVQQQQRRLDDDGARQRHALLLAAAQLRRIAVAQRPELHDVEHLVDAAAHLGLGRACAASGRRRRSRATVMLRPDRVALEDHRHLRFSGGRLELRRRDHLAVELDRARRWAP